MYPDNSLRIKIRFVSHLMQRLHVVQTGTFLSVLKHKNKTCFVVSVSFGLVSLCCPYKPTKAKSVVARFNTELPNILVE